MSVSAKRSILLYYGTMLGALMGFITNFIIVRTSDIGIMAYGAVTAAIAFIGIFSFISDFGLNTTHMKKVSEGKDEGKCLGVYFYLKSIVTIVFVVVSLSAVLTWKYGFGYGFEIESLEYLIYLAIIYFVLVSFTNIYMFHAYAKSEVAKVTIGNVSEFFVKDFLIIGGIIFFLLPNNADLNTMAIFIMIAYLIGVTIKLFFHMFISRKFKFSFLEKSLTKEYIKFTKPLILMGAGYALLLNTDIVMITYFGSLLDVGAYGLLKQVMFFITQIGAVTGAVLLPKYSKQHANKESKNVVIHILKSERFLSLLLIPIIVSSIVLAPSICNILKSDIIPYALTLQLLIIFSYINVIESPYRLQAISMNKPNYQMKVILVQLGLNVILNLIFIPQQLFGISMIGMGANGAALATLISALFTTIYMRMFVWKHLGLFINKKIFYHVIAGVISFLILNFIYLTFPVYSIFLVIAYFLVGVMLYAIIMFILRELSLDDIKWFLHVFNPVGIIKYIVDEIKHR